MKKIIILFFLLFFTNFIVLNSSVPITVLNCNGKRVYPSSQVKTSGRSAARKIVDAINDAMNKGKNCLPPEDYNSIKEKLNKLGVIVYLDCEMDDKMCGESHGGVYIKLHAFNNFFTEGCGCLKSVMLHELLHWGAGVDGSMRGEQKAYSCELKCFPECASNAGERYAADPRHCCK